VSKLSSLVAVSKYKCPNEPVEVDEPDILPDVVKDESSATLPDTITLRQLGISYSIFF
jgi:hypothetical protein